MYSPRQGNDYEYVEIYNTAANDVPIANWRFSKAMDFVFPVGATIAGQSYAVICKSTELFLARYKLPPTVTVFGNFNRSLSNDKDTIELTDQNAVIFSVEYKDSWDKITDGFGPSYEIVCHDADPSKKVNWKPSPVPVLDGDLEMSGTPGYQSRNACNHPFVVEHPELFQIKPRILFTEIMYHPDGETTEFDEHEFVEIFNAGNDTVNLRGWMMMTDSKLHTVNYVFAQNTTMQPGEFIIIARDVSAFRSVYPNVAQINVVHVVGNYNGDLSNGGAKLALVNDNGETVDYAEYEDSFPWAVMADGSGYSLHRINLPATKSNEVFNWKADAPNPGQLHAVRSLPMVTDVITLPFSNAIASTSSVTVVATVKPLGLAGIMNATVEWYIYMQCCPLNYPPVNIISSPTFFVQAADNIKCNAVLPPQPENTIIRYRFKIQTSNGDIIESPRPEDINEWHSYFVTPSSPQTTTPIYRIFITPPAWTQIWTNIAGGFCQTEDCCDYNDSIWDGESPATLVKDGRVMSVFVRYNGSPSQRASGSGTLTPWDNVKCGVPQPALPLSWHVKVPDHEAYDGREAFILQKNYEGCTFLKTPITYTLARDLGIPAPEVNFARLYVNGCYYRFVMDLAKLDDNSLEDFIEKEYEPECHQQASERKGHLFYAHGTSIGSATMMPVTPKCGWTAMERQAEVYKRRTQKWATDENLTLMIQELNSFNLQTQNGRSNAKHWFERNFDMNHILSYVALINTAGAWDDGSQNFGIYQRITDGKWTMIPWDMDALWGEDGQCQDEAFTCSLYLGSAEFPTRPGSSSNVLKNAVIQVFRDELNAKFELLARKFFLPDYMDALITATAARINETDLLESPGTFGYGDSLGECVDHFKTWQRNRNAYINNLLYFYAINNTANVTKCPSKPIIERENNVFTAPPGTPVLNAADIQSTSVQLVWTMPSANGASITECHVKTNSSAIIITTNSSLLVANLSPEHDYIFQVGCANRFGMGSFSAPLLIRTPSTDAQNLTSSTSMHPSSTHIPTESSSIQPTHTTSVATTEDIQIIAQTSAAEREIFHFKMSVLIVVMWTVCKMF